MRASALITLFALMAILIMSCSVHVAKVPSGQVHKSTAPGQVKKQTGSKSAKPYAPGQQKKG